MGGSHMSAVISLAFWIYLPTSSAVFWLIAVMLWAVTVPFDPRLTLLHRFTCWWGFQYIQLCPFWDVHIEGREHIVDGKRYMIVANHQSYADILVLFGIKKHFKWVSKSEIFQIPFIGWNMSMNAYVRLVRGDRPSVVKMLGACREHLKRGSSVAMFPEGTRSPDGEIHSFRQGSFNLAVEAGVPVIPVVVDGTRGILPSRGWRFRATDLQVRVRVLAPVKLDEANSDAATLSRLVRARMVETLAELRAPMRARVDGADRVDRA